MARSDAAARHAEYKALNEIRTVEAARAAWREAEARPGRIESELGRLTERCREVEEERERLERERAQAERKKAKTIDSFVDDDKVEARAVSDAFGSLAAIDNQLKGLREARAKIDRQVKALEGQLPDAYQDRTNRARAYWATLARERVERIRTDKKAGPLLLEALAAFELAQLGDGTVRTFGEILLPLREEIDGEGERLRAEHGE